MRVAKRLVELRDERGYIGQRRRAQLVAGRRRIIQSEKGRAGRSCWRGCHRHSAAFGEAFEERQRFGRGAGRRLGNQLGAMIEL